MLKSSVKLNVLYSYKLWILKSLIFMQDVFFEKLFSVMITAVIN